ncbi:large conductance mechanosensitive channel protein MscL [Brevibacterium litoralis]|uniref:large conductance mechanosensitive channel protein MscL n=1 Tax=Brevibacterium litoralis TaxID=3138935 RepID=UPI0032EF1EDC
MFQGFKDFLLRGNVIELATAVIVGAAFTAIVTAISEHVINPIIAAIGSPDSSALTWTIRPALAETTTIDLGVVITAAINFVIVAAVVYFVFVAPMNKVAAMRKAGADEEEVPPSTDDLLIETRDLLKEQNSARAQEVLGEDGPRS